MAIGDLRARTRFAAPTKAADRLQCKAEPDSTPQQADLSLWDTAAVAQWLHRIDMHAYKELFVAACVTGPMLPMLDDAALARLGISSFFHRLRILTEIGAAITAHATLTRASGLLKRQQLGPAPGTKCVHAALTSPLAVRLVEWRTGHVLQWLENNDLGHFVPVFQAHSVTGALIADGIAGSELVDMGVQNCTQRRVLAIALERLAADHVPSPHERKSAAAEQSFRRSK